ncbi:XRE family transcriptional regulator [Actinokineospora sp. NBRC 105648]|uniref:XRE family transcriptional regulator n=1 Tax=Actinokineospora sp. NBRC 105648 TaxID=3032206 RepID=UPI0024A4BD77|nr:XRE family transcriptional regulator [Actinokineospora sp. NBRC 105648]GLZ42896.1 hypothetical protein Acsp05_65200 [Actinokineospora sp. NBRC 105648]
MSSPSDGRPAAQPARGTAHSRELTRALRSGTFAEALDAAIASSGLTLDRVRHRLAEQGVDVSLATLSYWRRNVRRPERPESLRAVRSLERVLGLPVTSLITLLGPPRPRGRWLNRPAPATSPVFSSPFDDPDDGTFVLANAHDLFTVDEDRAGHGVRSRLVLRGETGTVTKCVLKYQGHAPVVLPVLTDVRFCRVGRTAAEPEIGRISMELLLDRPLHAGDHAVIEYEVMETPGHRIDYCYRQFFRRAAGYSQQVEFAGKPPARCHSYRQADLSAPETIAGSLPLGPSRTTLQFGRDVPPGIVGTRWHW